jgi:SAM-dependent methyltransferase
MAAALAVRRDECEQALVQLAKAGAADASALADIRRRLGTDLAQLVAVAAALQSKARSKLGQAGSDPHLWWVTEQSLQQASAWQVARVKASWFDDRTVYDLCCGIGGDAIRLAGRGPLVAVDRDALMVAMAAANLAKLSAVSEPPRVVCGDALGLAIPRGSGLHVDPDRRPGGTRRSRPELYQPSLADVLRIAAGASAAVIKLAPAARLDAALGAADKLGAARRCWISLSGGVREQSLLLGGAIERAGLADVARAAVAVAADGSAAWFAPGGEVTMAADAAARPLSWLIDPDAAVRAAGLTESFARRHQLRLLGHPSGFLTSADDSHALPAEVARMAVAGRVIWSGSCDDRKLRRELRQRGVFPATVKVRGTDHDPVRLRERYRSCGDVPVTLWIGRGGARAYAAITEAPAEAGAAGV